MRKSSRCAQSNWSCRILLPGRGAPKGLGLARRQRAWRIDPAVVHRARHPRGRPVRVAPEALDLILIRCQSSSVLRICRWGAFALPFSQ